MCEGYVRSISICMECVMHWLEQSVAPATRRVDSWVAEGIAVASRLQLDDNDCTHLRRPVRFLLHCRVLLEATGGEDEVDPDMAQYSQSTFVAFHICVSEHPCG